MLHLYDGENLQIKCEYGYVLEMETWYYSADESSKQTHSAIGGKRPSRFKIKYGISLCWKHCSSGHLLQFLRAGPWEMEQTILQWFFFLTDVLNLSAKTSAGRAVASSAPQGAAQSLCGTDSPVLPTIPITCGSFPLCRCLLQALEDYCWSPPSILPHLLSTKEYKFSLIFILEVSGMQTQLRLHFSSRIL